ncbi:MAG: tetratricopeptide repeat protein [Deltaproteobacteria bacterium]
MKKETIINAVTAFIFLVVGFLTGYMYQAHQQSGMQIAAVAPGAPAGAMGQAATGDSSVQGLPPGHPPLDISAAVKTLEDQAAQNPQDPQPALNLANLFYDNRRFQEATEWYQKALKLDPNNINARTDLGTAYFNLGQVQEALNQYNQSLKLDPKHEPTIFNTIIVNLEGTHDLAAARAAWNKLHDLNPNYKGLDALKQRLDAVSASAKP